MGKMFMVLVILSLSAADAQAQMVQIQGFLKDSLTNEAVISAGIYAGSQNHGVISNKSGHFHISVTPGESISISHMGYRTERINNIMKDTALVISMLPVNYILNTINVFSRKSSGGVEGLTIKNKQLYDFAGMTKDALRALQVLPGVSVNNEASAKINVRGGTNLENLILINDIEVNEPYHLKEGPATSIGIFNIDMVGNIDFSAGAFSAVYGDALSSVVKVDYKTGNSEKLSGKVNLGLIDLGLILEGPLFSENSTFIFGARRSYVDYIFKILNMNSDMHLSYHDFQGVYSYKFSKKNSISLSFILSKDDFNLDPSQSNSRYWDRLKINGKLFDVTRHYNENEVQKFNYSNNLFSLSSVNMLTDKLALKLSLSNYKEITDENSDQNSFIKTDFSGRPEYFMAGLGIQTYLNRQNITTWDVKTSLDYALTPFNTLSIGFNYKSQNYRTEIQSVNTFSMHTNTIYYPDTTFYVYPPDPQSNDTINTFVDSYKTSGYLQDQIQLFDDFFLNLGVRADYYAMNRQLVISPRVNASYMTPLGFSIKAGAGLFSQTPGYNQLKLNYADENNTKFQKAIHYLVGIDNFTIGNFSVKAEFYYKKYLSLVPTVQMNSGSFRYKKEFDAEGFAKGIDVQVIYSFDPVNFWISYGYLIVRERIKGTDNYYPRFTDQRNTLSAVINYDMGKSWSGSMRGFYGSGYAYTPSQLKYNDIWKTWLWVEGNKNSAHYPEYVRIDLRIEKAFKISGTMLNVFLDIMNITSRRNIFRYNYIYDEVGNPKVEKKTMFPIIPTVGLTVNF